MKAISEFKLNQFEKSFEDLSKMLVFKETAKGYYYRALASYQLKNYISSYKDIKKAYKLNNNKSYNQDFERYIIHILDVNYCCI